MIDDLVDVESWLAAGPARARRDVSASKSHFASRVDGSSHREETSAKHHLALAVMQDEQVLRDCTLRRGASGEPQTPATSGRMTVGMSRRFDPDTRSMYCTPSRSTMHPLKHFPGRIHSHRLADAGCCCGVLLPWDAGCERGGSCRAREQPQNMAQGKRSPTRPSPNSMDVGTMASAGLSIRS